MRRKYLGPNSAIENPDGADQGFIASYFPELLDKPLFHPPSNGTKLDGTYRLPLGYQMDASYYCLQLSLQREAFLPRFAECYPHSWF
ncbi:Putative glucuronosyltransferase pgsip8 [Trifolium repens]|nr:Putative glucuronosyltransferase pgsip8 [Trifolium repens]